MFHNYFFLKRLAKALHLKLAGAQLVECFSQNKDELILRFAGHGKTFYLRANLDPNVSLLSFPENFTRAGKNSIDLFPELENREVNRVSVFQFERSFAMHFEEHALVFKMHGRRSNVLLSKGDQVIRIFRKSLRNDQELQINQLHKNITYSKQQFFKNNCEPLQVLPALGKEVKVYLEKNGFEAKSKEGKWNQFQEVLNALANNPIYLLPDGRLSLLETSSHPTSDPIEGTNWLYERRVRSFYFEKEKQEAINKIKQRIKKSENYVHKTSLKLKKVERSRSPEELANLIMANLHQLERGMKEAVLQDFYTDETIRIKLSETLSPQKNAERLYRKSKNRHQEITTLQENIDAKRHLIEKLSRQVLHLDQLDDMKELRAYVKSLGLQKKKVQVAQSKTLPYHSFAVDGWEILLGKSAKANDELTLKIANKNDLWLHAKDVAGSHVIIKQKPGQNFPTHIIEKAGALAAANSKRKTDSLCPVIFTLKKYVRKAKGAPAGQVIVEKEDILMIEPMNIS